MSQAIIDRVVGLAEQVSRGEYAELKRLAIAFGGTWDDADGPEGLPVAHMRASNKWGTLTVGMPHLAWDVHAVVLVGYTLFGELWANLPFMNEAMEEYKRRWRKARKSEET